MAAADIVRVARAKVGSRAWLYSVKKDEFDVNTNKCNKFVYDVLVEAGVTPPPRIGTWWGLRSRPPLAGEWANPNLVVPGWITVTSPLPGDVVAEAHQYSDATGHVGIVVAAGRTVSAAALPPLPGTVIENDWGFRSGQTPVFKRCTYYPAPAAGGSPPSGPPPGR